MSLWEPEEFRRVASLTRLSERTVLACQDVLVLGMSGVDAAIKHGMFPAQISNGSKILRERQVELIKSAEIKKDAKETLKASVVQAARSEFGEDMTIGDAQVGCQYEGVGIVKADGFLIQRVGRMGVVHDLGKLMQVPNLDSRLLIKYPKDGGLASVIENAIESGKEAIER